MDEPKPMDAEGLLAIAGAFRPTSVLLSAVELDLFGALADGPRTAAQLAAARSLDARATDRLMDALCAMGLVRKQDGLFANTAAADRYLVRGRPEHLGGLAHQARLWRRWTTLPDAVRRGTRADVAARDEAGTEAFIAAMHARGPQRAREIAALVGLGDVRRLLDVGGGSGLFAIEFARLEPALRATVLDLPGVVPITQRYVCEAGLADRISTRAGDYHVADLGADHDLVFLSAVLHSNSREQNRALLRRCARALGPGGRVAVVDYIMSEDRTQPAAGTFFALNMLVGTEAGDTLTESELRGWLQEAGFIQIERRGPVGGDLMLGRRP